MHSFHRSRGRIAFEVLCTFVVAASCAGAWMQTGAWAFLPAAFALLLYGVLHAFDGVRNKPAVADQRSDFADGNQGDLPLNQDASLGHAMTNQQLEPEKAEEAEPVVATVPQENGRRKAKASRKAGTRRAKAPKKAQVTVLAPPEEVDLVAPLPSEQPAHYPLTPLFDPEPFVRQQRAVFGRKAG